MPFILVQILEVKEDLADGLYRVTADDEWPEFPSPRGLDGGLIQAKGKTAVSRAEDLTALGDNHLDPHDSTDSGHQCDMRKLRRRPENRLREKAYRIDAQETWVGERHFTVCRRWSVDRSANRGSAGVA